MKINLDLSEQEIKEYHIGEKFNRLTIIDKAPFQISPNGKKRRMVKCECDCTNHTIIICLLENVTRGHTKSCGCYKKEVISKLKSYNLKGKRFGRLVVQERVGSYHNQSFWHCKCDCGNEINLPCGPLVKGMTKSCGCLLKEHNKNFGEKFGFNKRKNITGQRFGKLIALFPNLELTEEKNKENTVQSIYWHCKCDCGNEVDVRLGNLQSGDCQSCGCIKSKGETKISLILRENNINFMRQKRFSKCCLKSPLPFDFYLPDYNLCIEYQGEHHFMPVIFRGNRKDEEKIKKAKIKFGLQIKKDNIKRNYCKENNIKLLEIPYWEKENIEEILMKVIFDGELYAYD